MSYAAVMTKIIIKIIRLESSLERELRWNEAAQMPAQEAAAAYTKSNGNFCSF